MAAPGHANTDTHRNYHAPIVKVRRPRAIVLNCATNNVREGEHFHSQIADNFVASLAAVDSDSWTADELTAEYIGLGWSEIRERSDAILSAAYPDTDRGRATQFRTESRARESLRASESAKVAERPAPAQQIAAEAVTARRSVWQAADPTPHTVQLGWVPC